MKDNSLLQLRGKIVAKYGTIKNFANQIGLSAVQVSKKLNQRAGFSKEDIEKWCKALGIDSEDIGECFFMLEK